MKRKLSLILCIMSCVLMMAGCSLSLTKTNENFDKKTLAENTDAFVSSWFEYDFKSAVSDYADQLDDDTLTQYKESQKLQEKYGEIGEKVKTEYTINSDSATVTETYTTGSGKKLIFSVTYDEEGNNSAWKVEEYKTLGQKMAKAGLNTVMAMSIVFVMLIFIAIIIAQFKHFSKLQNRKTETVQKTESAPAVPAAPSVEENLTDDLELVAVITAAIAAASETESADGLVIRSIIRR